MLLLRSIKATGNSRFCICNAKSSRQQKKSRKWILFDIYVNGRIWGSDPIVRGVADPYKHATPHVCHLAEFGR